MNPALRKFGFNEALLENWCDVIRRDVPDDAIVNEDEPIRPVSVAFCRLFKKPKKAWNACIKLNFHSFKYVAMKPGFHTFVCKIYDGRVLTVDVVKQPRELFRRVVEEVILGLADQALELKLQAVAEQQEAASARKAELAEKLGPNIDLKVPDGMVLDDAMIDSIHEVINNIQESPAPV